MFLKLKVHPAARVEKVIKKADDAYEIWVKAPAERGLANIAALRLLASHIAMEPKRLRIIKGAQCPSKIVKIL